MSTDQEQGEHKDATREVIEAGVEHLRQKERREEGTKQAEAAYASGEKPSLVIVAMDVVGAVVLPEGSDAKCRAQGRTDAHTSRLGQFLRGRIAKLRGRGDGG